MLAGSLRDPGGKLAGTFRDGSRTSRRRKRGLTMPATPCDGAEPCDARARSEGALVDGPGRGVALERGTSLGARTHG
jgi:hypothetical protein